MLFSNKSCGRLWHAYLRDYLHGFLLVYLHGFLLVYLHAYLHV
ncbi:hypothetical protein ACFV2L_00840 [Streptomyces sp. NPDC059687]